MRGVRVRLKIGVTYRCVERTGGRVVISKFSIGGGQVRKRGDVWLHVEYPPRLPGMFVASAGGLANVGIVDRKGGYVN